MMFRLSMTLTVLFMVCGIAAADGTLFPTTVPARNWGEFKAEGFSNPVCGVIYRRGDVVTNGMALGGIDTGCIDLETSGLLGYATIFNTHIPRRGPINLPVLGMSVGGKTWVYCDPKVLSGHDVVVFACRFGPG